MASVVVRADAAYSVAATGTQASYVMSDVQHIEIPGTRPTTVPMVVQMEATYHDNQAAAYAKIGAVQAVPV
jgi:hypothetical protein